MADWLRSSSVIVPISEDELLGGEENDNPYKYFKTFDCVDGKFCEKSNCWGYHESSLIYKNEQKRKPDDEKISSD